MQSILGSFLTFASLVVVVAGLMMASQATFGVALIATALYLAVLARLAQAERFQNRLLDLNIEAARVHSTRTADPARE